MGGAIDMKWSCEEGIIQIATGKKHQDEAVICAKRIRPYINDRPITLETDNPERIENGLFDRVVRHPDARNSYRDKILPLLKLPYKRTLFLDTDIELLSSIDDIFQILKSVDLVGCHAPVRWSGWRSEEVPDGFTEMNSGVLGIKRCSKQRSLIRYWLKLYDIIGIEFDQATLRAALWHAVSKRGLRTWVLPQEYNLRTPKPWLTGAGMEVKILHGRVPEEMREQLRTYLNGNIEQFRCSSEFQTNQNQEIIKHRWGK